MVSFPKKPMHLTREELDWLIDQPNDDIQEWLETLDMEDRGVVIGQLKSRSIEPNDTEEAEASLYEFMQQAWPIIEPGRKFIKNWHLEAIAEHLEAVSIGEITRLLINVPYRTTKSTLVSVMWPAWDWIKNPSRQWLGVSHVDSLATRDTRKMRLIVQSPWYLKQWPMSFAADQNEKTLFENDARGRRLSAGLNKAVTGEGADIIICDDVIDRDKAESDAMRRDAIEKLDEKVFTRLNDPGGEEMELGASGDETRRSAIVMIGQRLHESDPYNFVRELGYEHLCIPMEFEHDHPTLSKTSLHFVDPRTKDGELMWPARFSKAYVESEKKESPYKYAGQMQQRPSPRSGGMFKFEFFKRIIPKEKCPKIFTRMVRFWDKAATEGSGAQTAGVLMAKYIDPDRRNTSFFVIDVVTGQWSSGKRDDNIDLIATLDQTDWGRKVEIHLEQEGGGGGKQSAEISVNRLRGYRCTGASVAIGSKMERADPWATELEWGNVYLVEGAWNKQFIAEHLGFPRAKFKDQVDAASGAYGRLVMKRQWAVGVPG